MNFNPPEKILVSSRNTGCVWEHGTLEGCRWRPVELEPKCDSAPAALQRQSTGEVENEGMFKRIQCSMGGRVAWLVYNTQIEYADLGSLASRKDNEP